MPLASALEYPWRRHACVPVAKDGAMIGRLLTGLAVVACVGGWAYGQSCPTQTYFASPETGTAIEAVVIQSIDGAQTTLEIAAPSLTNDRVGDAVVRAHRRGVTVRVILAGGREGEIGSEYEKLLSAGVAVRLSSGSETFDHRFAVVDGRIVLSGTYEWTDQTLPTGFASLVRITCASPSQASPAQAYLMEFDRLWAQWDQAVGSGPPSVGLISSVTILSVDWTSQCIYLHNTTDRAIDVSYWSLSDLEGQYTFPAETEIPSNEPYRICIDVFNPEEDIDQLYLDPDGDEIFLVTPEGVIVDELVW